MRAIAAAYNEYTTTGPQIPAVAPPVASPTRPSDTVNPAPVRPAVAGGTGAAPQDAATAANLRSIASSYLAYTTPDGGSRTLVANYGDSTHVAAVILSQKAYLNDAAVYFTKGDPLAPKTLPHLVIISDVDDPIPEVNPDFANATLSFVFIANIPNDSPLTTTPVLVTRGLRDDGTWAPDSPYGGKGGYIAYLDGHVEWVTSFNLQEKLPPGAVILSAEPNGTQR